MRRTGEDAREFWSSFRDAASDSRTKLAENTDIDRVSSLIAGTLAKRGLAQHAMASLALHRVNGWLAARFASPVPPAKAERIAEGVLTIACAHSVVLQELQVQLPELRSFIAAECPFAAIAEIRLIRDDGKGGNALAPENPPA